MDFAYFTIELIEEIKNKTGKLISNSVIISFTKKRLIDKLDYKISPKKTGGLIFSQSGYKKILTFYLNKYKNNAPN